MKSSKVDTRKSQEESSEECMRGQQTVRMRDKALQTNKEHMHAALFEKFVDLFSSQNLSEAFLETMRNPLVLLDNELRVMWANLSFYHTFQLLPEETEHKVVYTLGAGEWDIPAFRALLNHSRLAEDLVQNVKIVHHFHRIGRKILLVSVRPVSMDEDKNPLFFISIDDVSEFGQIQKERSRFSRELEIEKSTLRSVVENAPEAIVVVDEQCRIILANQVAHKLYGRPVPYKQHVDSHNGLRICCAEGTPISPHDLPLSRSAVHGETCQNQELMLVWPTGEHRDLLVNTAPIRTKEGTIAGAVGIFQDITYMKNAQREREKLLTQLQSYADQLKEANEELLAQGEALQDAREDLETKVQERTAALLEVNQVLKSEIAERKTTEKRLRESKRQLRILSSKLLDAQEKERKLIAQELHDSIGGSLAAIKFSLEEKLVRARKGASPLEVSLEDTISMVRNVIEETRRISINLRPPLIDGVGILATIRWFGREFQEIYASIRLEYRLDITEDDVPEPLKIVIYRILQEALHNIAKHSHANNALISLQRVAGRILLDITDNGQGFDLKQKENEGIGLSSIKDRAALSGGIIEIQSHAGKGTTIRASWALTGV